MVSKNIGGLITDGATDIVSVELVQKDFDSIRPGSVGFNDFDFSQGTMVIILMMQVHG